MLVKCKNCCEKIDRDSAFKIVISGKNDYYCNEKEYIDIIKNRESKDKVYNLINEIFGYKVINTILFKEISELIQFFSYSKISAYIKENMENLNRFMSKDFSGEYGKIRYFTAILKNNLRDYKEKSEEVIKQSDVEIIESKYQPQSRKQCINEFIAELEG